MTKKLVAGNNGSDDRCWNPNKNTGDSTSSTKRVVTFYQQWIKYCHLCEVVLNGKSECSTGSEKNFYLKKEGHKDAATFTNKMGDNTKRDHLLNLWCEPGTNRKVSVLPAGAKTEKWWFGRELSKNKNTDNANKNCLS